MLVCLLGMACSFSVSARRGGSTPGLLWDSHQPSLSPGQELAAATQVGQLGRERGRVSPTPHAQSHTGLTLRKSTFWWLLYPRLTGFPPPSPGRFSRAGTGITCTGTSTCIPRSDGTRWVLLMACCCFAALQTQRFWPK